jgi:hypothetical protein
MKEFCEILMMVYHPHHVLSSLPHVRNFKKVVKIKKLMKPCILRVSPHSHSKNKAKTYSVVPTGKALPEIERKADKHLRF